SHGIPVQEIEIETIRQGEQSWPFTIDNIALACYVKMGGTPWTISTYEQTHHELIIGMGNAVIQKARGGRSEKFVGITNVFSADGNYLLNNISREIQSENYKEELLESLKSTINEISKSNAWKSGDNVRLIFHQQFKDFRQEDVDAIKEFVSQYKELKIEFCFVRISEDHPYQIYDTNQNGIEQKYGSLMKGEYAPQRGVCIEVGPRTILLCVTAPEHLMTPLQGIPKPLQITLHRDSTYQDLNYIAKQVYHFTFLNWRTFNPT
ncbi:MAG: hypothetical protein KGL95_04870, partial [Patescibacteria group bacterium]|nr:hypothetical protein [Patescibacteria group bacterium]